jgi:hypothetical protein
MPGAGPITMDFSLEGHADQPTGVSYQLTAYNNETREWEIWSEGDLSSTDTVITISDIQKPFHYINPDTLRLKLRLTALGDSPFHLFLDELYLRTTFP